MITLNEIAYNIQNIAYGGNASLENNISLTQIKHWIHYHRAQLIADNIDKGITNNQALYQQMSMSARNSTRGDVRDFYNDWDAYDIDSSLATPTVTGKFLSNLPKNSAGNRLNGEWIAYSSMSADNNGHQQSYQDSLSRSFYGDEIASFQVRGDFRNLGYHSFWIPKPLQLKNDEGIKEVLIDRAVHFPDNPATANENEETHSYAKRRIKLYRKEYYNFDEYNKFTNITKPYYMQRTAQMNRDDGYDGYNYITFKGLQVSPNYHSNLNSPANKKLFWKYRGYATMILEDPTKIDMMYAFSHNPVKNEYDDANTPYPIPMEYVSELIQRVVQIEIKAELTTQSDMVTDGLDDNLKRQTSGPQVQK